MDLGKLLSVRRAVSADYSALSIQDSCHRETICRKRRPKILSSDDLCHIVPRAFTPVLAKHSKSFSLIDCVSMGVDKMQRNFGPMQRQVEHWRQTQITDERAKLIFYSAFVDGKLDAPKSLLPEVHRLL